MEYDLTRGNLFQKMIRFAVPFLIACFLQTFYGMADLFITGQFCGAAVVTAVAVGSQVMHMLTVVLVGLATGTTVCISRSVGAGDRGRAARFIGNSVALFAVFAAALTVLLLLCTDGVVGVLRTPPESVEEARNYLVLCFVGVPFITAYNVIGSIFRGLGDSRSPMIFVAVAGLINIGLDYLLIGPLAMGAAGAAAATVASQALSVVFALVSLRRRHTGLTLRREDFRPEGEAMRTLLGIGAPIAVQEGLIQISFLVITRIANDRGVDIAAAVGVVEKVITFLFLVPSAMLSTVSAVAAQNAGAGLHGRGRQTLHYGIRISVGFGLAVCLICQFAAAGIVGLFVPEEPEVIRLGGEYLRTYSLDCVFAGFQFCFSGYFSAYGRSGYSFLHNMVSVLTVRIPGAWLASVYWPATLYPMGLAPSLGSLLSTVICVVLYRRLLSRSPELQSNQASGEAGA